MAAKAGAKIVCLHVGKLDDYILKQHGVSERCAEGLPVGGLNRGLGCLMTTG